MRRDTDPRAMRRLLTLALGRSATSATRPARSTPPRWAPADGLVLRARRLALTLAAPRVTCDRGRWYWVKRVPARFRGVVLGRDGQPVTQVRQALHTDSRTEALRRAAQVERERMAEWEALAAGDGAAAHRHYAAAVELAAARGFPYIPLSDLASGDLETLVKRLLSLSRDGDVDLASPAAAAAVMGTVPVVLPDLRGAWEEYRDRTAPDRALKSAAQERRWRKLRETMVAGWESAMVEKGHAPDVPVDKITRAMALDYRDAWATRIAAGLTPDSENKHIGGLSAILTGWCRLRAVTLPNPFAALRFKSQPRDAVPPFSRAWVRDRIAAPGALDALIDEAADVFLVMVNTGARPSEVTDAPLSDWHLDAPIPYLSVAQHGREVKVAHTVRDLPLLGVSLEAATRIVARGGSGRYFQKADSWSGYIGKALRRAGLMESPRHVPYSMRHYVEDALQEAGADDRYRADILGQKYERPRYGSGGALRGRRDMLARIAL